MDKGRPRVLVIGLDGATFDLLDSWIERGLMPNLKRLIGEGVRAPFRSVLPPVTAPAWTSFSTGVKPGKHGVFDFRKRVPGQLCRQIVSARDIRVPTVWSLLAEAGLKAGIVNVPVTYPPSEKLSFAISDMLTPSTAVCFTQPANLYEELRPQLGEYVIDAPPKALKGFSVVDKFLDDMEHCTRQRARYAVHLMKTRPWDFCMTVFVSPDRLQHVLWDVLSGEFSVYPATPEIMRIKEKAEQFVSKLDGFIGDMLAVCPPETDVFFVSDHGFGPMRSKVKLNQWLARQGLLTPSRRRGKLGRLISRADIFKLRHKLALRFLLRGKEETITIPFWRWINWARTQAYAASTSELGIYVNQQGREAEGIVRPGAETEQVIGRIIEGLRKLPHPQTGKPMVTDIWRREELFAGPHIEHAPDVVFMLEGNDCTCDLRIEGPLFEKPFWHTGTGTHRLDGIFIAHGPRINKGLRLEKAEIIDVAPTVLHLFGLPIPDYMDGRILTEILTDEAKATAVRTVEMQTPSQFSQEPQAETPYSEEEAREVEKRLQDLGYL